MRNEELCLFVVTTMAVTFNTMTTVGFNFIVLANKNG